MKSLFLLTLLFSFVWGLEKHNFTPSNIKDGKFMKVRILDSKIIEISKIEKEKFHGISGLSYDENRDIFYLLNDRGRLFSARVLVRDGKIVDFIPINGYRLKDKFGKKFLKPKRDSEGMAIVQDGDKKSLLISFEGYPRVIEFDVYGRGVKENKKNLTLPKKLQNIKNYQGRNSSLEALTYHPRYGILTTGEFPLKGQKDGYQGIYNSKGEVCKFKKDYFENAVTEFEVMSDGNLLVLGRDFDFKSFSISITLKKIYLKNIENGRCKVENLAVFTSEEGWDLDNFEGLTHYKDNIYFMISDDNGNFLQKTILTMFEVSDSK